MLKGKIIKYFVPLFLILGVLTLHLNISELPFIKKNNNVGDNEIAVEVDITNTEDFYELTYLNEVNAEALKYYYKQSSGVFKIYDPVADYEWKTGLDVVDSNVCRGTSSSKPKGCLEEVIEVATGIYPLTYNSLFILQYFTDPNTNVITALQSSSGSLQLYRINANNGKTNHYRLDVDFSKTIDIQVKVHIYIDETGYNIEIRRNEISGNRSIDINQIWISPFLGASGGSYYNQSTSQTGLRKMTNGYIVVPDGSGSIIPFQRNIQSLGYYYGYVYGKDLAQGPDEYSYSLWDTTLDVKDASMPMFGIAHTDTNTGFVAYATKGEEYMNLTVHPDNNALTRYTYIYPAFTYNFKYWQAFNSSGAGVRSTAKTLNDFDLNLRYTFLNNEKANYAGMAQNYSQYLINSNQLKIKTINELYQEMPIRLDFIMSDVQNSVVGTTNVVVTKANDANAILQQCYEELEFKNVVSSLYGWQNGGITLGSPYGTNFSNAIGSSNDFKNLIQQQRNHNYDVSMAQNYNNIFKEQITYNNNAVKHYNGFFLEVIDPLKEFLSWSSYARSERSAEWMKLQFDALQQKVDAQSMTINGSSNTLSSHHNVQSRSKAKENIYNGFQYVGNKAKVNADRPNKFLWNQISRYFNAPVVDSQYTMASEAIPLLQMVLSMSNIEVYSAYCNFSFYNQDAVLKMIDFNVFPSFILSQESSHLLLSTNSADLYSTEYSLYKDVMKRVYQDVSTILNEVMNLKWISREKLANNLVVNSYENNVQVIINYTDKTLPYGGIDIAPQSAKLVGGH